MGIPPVHQRLERRSPADEDRANPLRGADLVTGKREEVYRKRLYVDHELADVALLEERRLGNPEMHE